MQRIAQRLAVALCLVVSSFVAHAEAPDPALAKSLGADENGMRHYVLVILKTGPKRMPPGAERNAMFSGHFANITRLADEGKLAVAGPFEGTSADGWRGLFVFATGDVEEAKRWVATDPVIVNGEMVADFRPFYGSAALMAVPQTHARIAAKAPGG